MKIRIKGNSLRLRLTQTEVKQFATAGVVAETVVFGWKKEDQLQYILERFEGEAIRADYQAGKISVKVPFSMAEQWTSTEMVGMRETINFAENQSLSILIEKDFQCMKPRVGEDESDHFSNPEM